MPLLHKLFAGKPVEHKIELIVTGDFSQSLADFLVQVGKIASGGHSFDLEADREFANKGKYPKVGIDGDGSDRIIEVRFDGKKVK